VNELSGDPIRSVCFVRTGGLGDDAAFARAIRLCEHTKASLCVLSVLEEPPAGLLRLLASYQAEVEEDFGEANEIAELARLTDLAHQQGVAATYQLLRGPVFLEIIRMVIRDGHDLVVKSAQPSGGVRRILFGHVDRQLLRKCPCRVLLNKPSAQSGLQRILAAVDPEPFDDASDAVRQKLNRSILDLAVLQARIEQAELHVVHVWPFQLEGALQNRAGVTEDSVTQLGETIRRQHEQALAELLSPYTEDVTRVHLLKGRAGEEVAKLAVDQLIDVVVMGTLCRSGISGWLIGNTAETVVDQVDCSVLSIKPPGFVSPVEAPPQ